MKYIILILLFLSGYKGYSQGYPNTDSLRTYNIKYITNNAATAFTNLRLHTLLRGIIDHIDTARSGGGSAIGIDTLYALNDSTIRYRKNGVFRNTVLKGVYDTRRKVDTAYALNDSTLQIKINGTNRNIIIPGRHWTLQQVLNNGSTLTENENIVLADSVEFTSGLVVVDSLQLRTLTTTADTTTYKPLAVGTNGRPVKFTHWPGAASGNFIVGDAAPLVGQGVNGDRFFHQPTSQWYKKAGGVWGSALGYIQSDTVEPISTSVYTGQLIKMKAIWDTAAYSWSDGIARNQNVIGNELLAYKDDPVRTFGWNVNATGNLIDNWKAGYIFHFESNFDTKQFGEPWFERHESVLFRPGSEAYTNYVSGERIWSVNASKERYDIHTYGTMGEFYLQWRESPGASHTRYLNATPGALKALRQFKLDSVYTGNDWLYLDNVPYGFRENSLGLARNFFKRTGFADTCTLRITTGGDFVFQTTLGSGRTLFNLPFGTGLGTDGAVGGSSGKASFQADQTGDFYSHKYDVTDGSHSFKVKFQNSIYGIGLNTTTDRQAYLDITNLAGRFNFNNYYTSDINQLDSAGNGINFNFERKYNGSFTSANLASGKGYALKLNTVSNFGTEFTSTQASNSEYTADFVWKSRYSTVELERMRLSDTGYLYVKSLDTDLTPPATSGTTRLLVSDNTGLISSVSTASISGITSINSQTGPAITLSGGIGTYTSAPSSNTIAYNVDPTSDIFTRTLDAQYTDANNTGTSQTDLYTKTIAANTIGANGVSVNFECAGVFNDATATVNLEVLFGGNSIAGTGAVTISGTGAWTARGMVIRTGTTTARAYTTVQIDNSTQKIYTTMSLLTGLDFTASNILKITGTAGGGGGGSNDITAQMWKVIYQPQ